MPPTPEQIAKLPRWARDHIENLKRLLERETRTNSFYDGKLLTDTSIQGSVYRDDNQPLPRGAIIQFDLELDQPEFRRRSNLSIRRLRERPAILIMGSDCISIEPHSGNVCIIGAKQR